MPAAALADGDLLGAGGERERVRMHERVVKDDVGLGEQARSADRQQVGRAGAGADEIDGALRHRAPQASARAAPGFRPAAATSSSSSDCSATQSSASPRLATLKPNHADTGATNTRPLPSPPA